MPRWRRQASVLCGLVIAGLTITLDTAAAHPQLDRRGPGVTFAGLPQVAFQGQRIAFTIFARPIGKSCALDIHYTGGRTQRFQIQPGVGGTASASIRIPAAPPGPATLKASCSGSGSATGRLLVKWALQAPKLVVARRGFSQRVHPYDGSSDVNFGLAITNARTHADATNVAILVNFVDASNRVLGSAHLLKPRLPAATTTYVGGQSTITTHDTVTRIEVVFVAATSADPQLNVPVLISDPVVLQDMFGFVQVVRGQLLNKFQHPLQGADVGVLFEDGSGNIIGGGSASASGPLSLGAREAFEMFGSFSAVPYANVAAVRISAIPSYA